MDIALTPLFHAINARKGMILSKKTKKSKIIFGG